MNINLSWDLFIIVFFSVIVAYSFIIGRNQTLKIVIASYIAILAADGIGNIIERYLLGEKALISLVSLTDQATKLIILKIMIFVFTIVLITTKGRFQIDMGNTKSYLLKAILSVAYGVLSAGLIVSTILIYASGASLVQGGSTVINPGVLAMYNQSFLVKAMIDNYNIWFSLPAMTFVISSLVRDD